MFYNITVFTVIKILPTSNFERQDFASFIEENMQWYLMWKCEINSYWQHVHKTDPETILSIH